jgi:hypothetical protein
MGTAISRRGGGLSRAAVGLAALVIGCAGCGGSGHTSSGPAAAATGAGSSASTTAPATGTGPSLSTTTVSRSAGGAAFAWLRPRATPAGWQVARIATGAQLAYPPTWRRIKGDPGTATAALKAPSGRYLGYLNVTPQQGEETLSDWRTFRIEHNHEEGDRSVVRLAYAGGLRFLDGHGNCVKDAYISGTGVHYIEIACLVSGAKATSVIVGAGPPSTWRQVSGSIERAIAGFRT